MEYIKKYIYAVTKNLPEKDRKEVSQELQGNIMDMLGDDQSEENIRKTLEKMGNPYEMSLEYLGKDDYLIGPRLYHKYIEVLKVIFFVGLIIGFISFTVDFISSLDSLESFVEVIEVVARGLGNVGTTVIGFIFWVTVIFAVMEKTKSYDEIFSPKDKEFKVSDLKDIPKKSSKKISKVGMVFALFFTVLFLWLLLMRSDLIAVYTSLGSKSIPIFNDETIKSLSWLILFAGALSILLSTLKFIYGRWNAMLGILAACYAMVNLGMTIIFVTRENLLTQEFLNFLEEGARITGIDFLIRLPYFTHGFLVFISIVTLLDIGTSLYNGFRSDKQQDNG